MTNNQTTQETIFINSLFEWAVWGHLDSINNLELILLKGHLILEVVIESFLKKNNIADCQNYSFYKKVLAMDAIKIENKEKMDFIVTSLKEINKLRNNVAHEFFLGIKNGEFEDWSSVVLKNLKGKKFTKHTFRTKIVHSFSVLSINILEL